MPTQGDYIDADLGSTETTETDLGDIVVPSAGVSRIVGIWGICAKEEATLKEGTLAFFRLAFKSVPGVYKFPAVVGGGGTTSTADAVQMMPNIIPVDIPVPPNETISCYMVLSIAQTATCRGAVGVIFE